VKLNEWIQYTNKFLRQDSLKLSQEIIDELSDPQHFLLLDFDTQTLFTAKLGLNNCQQVPKASTVRQQSGYDWNKEPNHELDEAHHLRAALEEQRADIAAVLGTGHSETRHDSVLPLRKPPFQLVP